MMHFYIRYAPKFPKGKVSLPGAAFHMTHTKMEKAWAEIKDPRYRTLSPLLHAASAGVTLAAGCPGTPPSSLRLPFFTRLPPV